MRCPSCGTVHSAKQCPQSITAAASALALSSQELESGQTNSEMARSDLEARPVSRLIEFPGVAHRGVPQWRKELSERVREVQERRASEAGAEAEKAERMQKEQPDTSAPQLELVPQAEVPAMNPVVAAALRRIERAYEAPPSSGYSRASAAVAVAANNEAEANLASFVSTSPTNEIIPPGDSASTLERPHNLVVVQAPLVAESEPASVKPKPKRLIVDDPNDPALSYLDSIRFAGASVAIAEQPSLLSRFTAAVIDVIAVGFLSLPFAAIIELEDGNWHQPRIMVLMGVIAAVVMFVYATVSTALTGRTLGMRMVSLRAIDVRTGLIPTGKQSAGRALVYLFSLATMGIGLLLAFAGGEGKTAHDRLSRTAVVRD